MGKEKTTQQSQTTQSYQPAPYETELNKLGYEQALAADPLQRELNQAAGSNVLSLLQGKDLPGYLKGLPYGISENVTSDIVNKSLRDVNAQLKLSGAGSFLESDASKAIGARTAADIRNASEQFNIQNLMQLLNIGVGGQASVQQPILESSKQLSGRLAGLRTVTSTGSGTTYSPNPFLSNFQQYSGRASGSLFGNPFNSFGLKSGG